jgi:class 3 adenylate cyclase
VSALPTGTVTFLFADVEGSTALQSRAPVAYPEAIAHLRRMMRETVWEKGGAESDAVGDEYVAAFGDAPNAAVAALEIQRRLRDAEWPGGLRVRVRLGLHTGSPALGDEGYTGIDVVRASRIANAGHGGQILVSADTLGALADIASRDLGEFRLAGLTDPERIHQLLADDLPRDFPPLRNTISTLGAWSDRGACRRHGALREGVARLLTDSGFDVVAQSGNPTISSAMSPCTSLPSPSSTSACLRRTRTRASGRRGRSGSDSLPRPSSCSRSTSSRRTQWISSPSRPRVSATS